MSTDTIAAIGTALSNSGISIIRISGEKSLSIIKKIFKTSKSVSPNTIVFGKIVEDSKILDNVLVSYFKSPSSYTGEDVCEINCHGGVEITKQILELVLENGARLAEPGEFSKRAFLNGKMDLVQAESVINLINAKSRTESRIAINNLEGNISKNINSLREDLVGLLAHIEVSVDYPEYDYEEVENKNVIKLLDEKIEYLENILNTYEQGRYIQNGINVVILGKPNVGKSSLLNKFANYEKAIVTDIPGTTRDVIDERINIGNVVLNLSDTAGIRDTEDIVEKIGVDRSIKKIDEADLVIYILSATQNIEKGDLEIISKIQNKGIKLITLINKMDKMEKSILDTIMLKLMQNNVENILKVSIQNDIGIDDLKNKIEEIFNTSDLDFEQQVIITNSRHKDLIKKAITRLSNSKEQIINGDPIDIVSIGIKDASDDLGKIVGKNISSDIINKIFEKFCLGK